MTDNSRKGDPKPRPMREIEDEFFGITDALSEGEARDEETIHHVQASIRGQIETAKSDDPETVIDRLQSEGKLPESLYAPQLASLLKYLGSKLGIAISITDPETTQKVELYPHNELKVDLTTHNLAQFLRKGSIAAAFLMPLISASVAYAQPLGPGQKLFEETSKYLGDGNIMYHWENLLILLLLLGVTAYVARKIVQKYQKTEMEKQALEKFDEYTAAGKKKDDKKKEKAKKDIYVITMGQLPTDMDESLDQTEIADKDELKKVLEIKKMVDRAIFEAEALISRKMILPKGNSISALNNKKDEVVHIIEDQLLKMGELYGKLAKEWSKEKKRLNDPGKTSFLLKQIELEKKKIKYFKNYLGLMKLKWLMLIQNAKNELFKAGQGEALSKQDQLLKDIFKDKQELDSLLENQMNMSPGAFTAKLDALQKKMDDELEEAQKMGMEGFKEEEKEIGYDSLKLLNHGKYDESTGINYEVNGQPKHVDLSKDVEVQIWIDENNKITMNYNLKGFLLESLELAIANQELVIKKTKQPLSKYINEKKKNQKDDEAGIPASSEIGPEAEPVLNSLAALVQNVSKKIKSKDYEHFGDEVEADDEVIKYHLMRVHREFIKGKPNTVLRFVIDESYWKKALADLQKQSDIPKHTIDFNYSNEKGVEAKINMAMLRFNIEINKKQASVLVPATDQYKAMAGEIRVVFDPDADFSADEIKAVISEAVKRLGIAGHIKPVTPEARAKLQERLKEIRKEKKDPAGAKEDVHTEYSAEKVKPESVEELKKKGLHSLYHQFDADNLEQIFQVGKLLATTTRWAKGILKNGLSSPGDYPGGGATEAFTRIHTTQSAKEGTWYSSSKPAIVFSPDILSRMDCYCYTEDKWGSKMPGVFDQRVSPAKLLEMMKSSYHSGNEVMFYDALDLAHAEYIVDDNPAAIIERLKKIGITKIGKKPLEKAVITRAQFKSISSL